MKTSTRDAIEGNVHEVKGKIKQETGKIIGNPDLEAEGKTENLAGKVQKKVGQVKEVFEK